jgi:mono/diheme cytochrome c family protein
MGTTQLKALVITALAGVLLVGCGDNGTNGNTAGVTQFPERQAEPGPEPVEAWYTSAQVRRGREIYSDNCASCHGSMGQGARNWRQRGPDGNFPAPPLNGSGHTWHHPKPVLEQIIRDGGPANMPAWGHTLSDAEIEAVLAYVQSLWPAEIYARWAQQGRQG